MPTQSEGDSNKFECRHFHCPTGGTVFEYRVRDSADRKRKVLVMPPFFQTSPAPFLQRIKLPDLSAYRFVFIKAESEEEVLHLAVNCVIKYDVAGIFATTPLASLLKTQVTDICKEHGVTLKGVVNETFKKLATTMQNRVGEIIPSSKDFYDLAYQISSRHISGVISSPLSLTSPQTFENPREILFTEVHGTDNVIVQPLYSTFDTTDDRSFTRCKVHGYIRGGVTTILWITAEVTLPYRNMLIKTKFEGFESPPTTLSVEQLKRLKSRFVTDLEGLASGIDDIVHLEYVLHRASIDDPFPNIDLLQIHLYMDKLLPAWCVRSALDICTGSDITPSRSDYFLTHVVKFSLVTDKPLNLPHLVRSPCQWPTDIRQDESIDVEFRFDPSVQFRYRAHPPDDPIILGLITARGDDFDSCVATIKRVRSAVLHNQEMLPLYEIGN